MTITLAAASTLQGVAGSATAITATAFGDEVSTADSFKKLYQGQLPSSAGVLYTVPGSTQTIIKAISLVNTTAGAVTAVLFVDGTAAANRIMNLTVPANGFATYDADGWKVFDATGQQLFVGATGATGSTGSTGAPGTNGTNGWSPIFAVVSNGSGGFVLQIVNWTGGTGSPPSSTNQFIGSSGIVGTAAAAQDIRGAAGAPGASVLAFGIVTGNTGTATADASPDTIAITGANGITTAATDTPDGLVITGANAFGVVTGTTGTATSDTSGDTLAITGANGISTAATDTPDGLVITGSNDFAIVTGNSGTATADVSGDTIAITGTGNITTAATDTPDGLVVATTPAATSKISSHYYAFGDFGIVGDWQVVFDGTCSTGSPGIITSATAAFVSGDVGKRITLSNAGASGAKYVGTISSLNSGTSVNVTPNISTTVTNQGMNWGTNNDTAWGAMATAVNALTYAAVVVEFERTVYNRYGLGVLVAFNKPVILQGQGRAYNADTGNYQQVGGTCIAWVAATSDGGTPFGSALTWVPTGLTNIKGGGLRDLWFDGRNGDQAQALTGVKLASVNGFSIREWFVIDCLAFAHRFEIDATPTEQESTARGMMSNVGIRMLDNPAGAITTPITTTSAVTLTATGQNLTVAANSFPAAGYGWIMTSIGRPVLFQWTSGGGTTTLAGCRVSAEDAVLAPVTVSGSNVVPAYPGNGCAALLSGNATANTNLSLFQMWQISHGTTWGPAAIEFANADSMVCDSFVINGGSITATNAINRVTKPGVRFNGHDTNISLAARNNVFRDGDAGAGGVSNMALLNTGAKMTAPAGPNYWWDYQLGNGAPAPVSETLTMSTTQGNAGGSLDYTLNGGFYPGLKNFDASGTSCAATVLTHVRGSLIPVPPQGYQNGALVKWTLHGSKTAAGLAARNIHVRLGTTGSTSDAIISTIASTGTAAADTGTFEIWVQFTGFSGTAQVVSWQRITHQTTATGFTTLVSPFSIGTATAFNSIVSNIQYLTLTTTTGASEVITWNICQAEVLSGKGIV